MEERNNNEMLRTQTLPNGRIMTEFLRFGGEEDFYRAYALLSRVLRPEDSKYSVDSLCVSGSFKKDGLTVRMSSEGLSEHLSFVFGGAGWTAEDTEKAAGWLRLLDEAMTEG